MNKPILNLISCLLLCGLFSCQTNEVEQYYYENYSFYQQDQIEDFVGHLGFKVHYPDLYDLYWSYPPILRSTSLPSSEQNPGSWYKGKTVDHLAEGSMILKFGITSNTTTQKDTILFQTADILFRKVEVKDSTFWMPLGIKDSVDINSDLKLKTVIGWHAVLDKNNEYTIELDLSNHINLYRGINYPYNYQLSTFYGIFSSTDYTKIHLQSLLIKSDLGNISFYDNNFNHSDDLDALELNGQELKRRILANIDDENLNYKDLEYFVSLEWVEREVPNINYEIK